MILIIERNVIAIVVSLMPPATEVGAPPKEPSAPERKTEGSPLEKE